MSPLVPTTTTTFNKASDMKHVSRTAITTALFGAGLILAAQPAFGVTYNLTAEAFTKTLDLPTGPRDVLMWGFKSSGSSGPATSPGPELVVPPTQTSVVINLTNNLNVPVSIVIPNQNGYVRGAAEHATMVDSAGRTRATSLVKETPPGGTVTYTWNNVTPGTYLYYSGSHSSLQVQMGLYGMVRKNFSTPLAYANVLGLPPATAFPFSQEVSWIFGEIDFAIHDAISAGTYDTTVKSMIHSVPDIFLLNGEPFSAGEMTTGLPGSGAALPTLIRMVNACYDERIPVVNGYHLRVVAEDGRRFTFPKIENAVNLPALKTKDLQLAVPRGTVVKFFDRRALSLH